MQIKNTKTGNPSELKSKNLSKKSYLSNESSSITRGQKSKKSLFFAICFYVDLIYTSVKGELSNEVRFFAHIIKTCAKATTSRQAFYYLDSHLFYVLESSKEDFANIAYEISSKLPFSLFFSFQEIFIGESLDELLGIIKCTSAEKKMIKKFSKQNNFYTPLEIEEFLNEESKKFNNPRFFSYIKDLSNDVIQSDIPTFKDKMQQGDVVVCANISVVKTYFRVQEDMLIALASFEKPRISLVPKDIFKSEFILDSRGEVLVCLPYDIQVYSYFLHTKKDKVFLSSTKNLHIHISVAKDICILQNLASNMSFIDFLKVNLANQAYKYKTHSPKKLLFYISSKRDSHILLYEEGRFKQILKVAFISRLEAMFLQIAHNYESGAELLKNFAKVRVEFAPLLTSITSKKHLKSKTKNDAESSANIFDILALIAELLNLGHNVDALIRCANSCLLQKGPRIDFVLKTSADSLSIEIPRILRSVMSFVCAGVDRETICFGVIDSFCEFLSKIYLDMRTNYACQIDVLLCGDAFSSHIFLERLRIYLPNDSRLLAPAYLDL